MATETPTDELARIRRVAARLDVAAARWVVRSAITRALYNGAAAEPERWGWYSSDYPDEGMTVPFDSEIEALRDGIEAAADGRAYCARCGCTEDDPCEGGCVWATDESAGMDDVCSACVAL